MGWQLAREGIECRRLVSHAKLPTFQLSHSPRQVTLNGHLLQLVDNTSLPELEPVEQEASGTISLPALSLGFQVFKEANVKACMYSYVAMNIGKNLGGTLLFILFFCVIIIQVLCLDTRISPACCILVNLLCISICTLVRFAAIGMDMLFL